jgi:thioester reductase-like protein
MGYAESKAVTERLLQVVREERGLQTCSVRVGQLSGSTTNGYWATTDWVPNIIKSSSTLGQLPLLDEMVTWMPTDVCAAALLELEASRGTIRHLHHTRPVHWKDVFSIVAQELHLELVPSARWIDALEKVHVDADKALLDDIPALKLLGHFKQQMLTSSPSSSITSLDCTHSLEESETLRMAPQLSQSDVKQWISHWKDKGFL